METDFRPNLHYAAFFLDAVSRCPHASAMVHCLIEKPTVQASV
jgi:hypothetical protein